MDEVSELIQEMNKKASTVGLETLGDKTSSPEQNDQPVEEAEVKKNEPDVVSQPERQEQLADELSAESVQEQVETQEPLRVADTGSNAVQTATDEQLTHFAIAVNANQAVHLAGSFNHWTPEPMKWNDGSGAWERSVELKPGRWSYKFIVDGEWVRDPENPFEEQSEYGGINSVIEVQ